MTEEDFNIINNSPHVPKVHKVVVDGLPYIQFKSSIEYLNKAFKDITTGVDGLKFEGVVHATPKEVYQSMITSATMTPKKGLGDIRRNDIIKVLAKYTYKDNKFTIPAWIPHINPKGLWCVNSSWYGVKPVLTDPVFSIDRDTILDKTLMKKSSVSSIPYTLTVVDELPKDIEISILHSRHVGTSKEPVPIGVYMLWEHGLDHYGLKIHRKSEYVENPDEVYIYEHVNNVVPIGLEPGVVSISRDKYNKNTLLIAGVLLWLYKKHSVDLLHMITERETFTNIIGTLFYAENRMTQESYINVTKPRIEIDSITASSIADIRVLLDVTSKTRLEEEGIFVDNYFEALEWLIYNHTELKSTNGIENKYMDSLYYLLFHTTSQATKAILTLKNLAYRYRNDGLNYRLVLKTLSCHSPLDSIRRTYGPNRNITVEAVSCPNDIGYFISSKMELQGRAKGVNATGSRFRNNLSTVQAVTAADTIIGTVNFPTKAFNNPKASINMFVDINPVTGKIIISEQRKLKGELLDFLLQL